MISFNLGMLKPTVRTEFVRSTRLSYDERARFSEDFLYLFELFLKGGDAAVADTPYYFYTQPFGTASRQWSHGARRRYDFQAAGHLLQSHLRDLAGRLSPYQMRSLNRRCRRLGALENFFRAKESFARRGWRGFIARLVKHPATFDYAMHRLCDRYLISAAARVATASRRRSIRARDGSSRPRLPAHAKS